MRPLIQSLRGRVLAFTLLSSGFLSGSDALSSQRGEYLKGYLEEISGETIGYHSHHPYAAMALLTRATDGAMAIEWATEPIPADYTGEYVEFYWLGAFSSGTSSANTRFDVRINGDLWFTFTTKVNEPVRSWTVSGRDGAELRFEGLWEDQVADHFGAMVMKVPARDFARGKPLRVNIVGEKANRRDWYMTFKYSPAESVAVRAQPALLRGKDVPTQLVEVLIDHVSPSGTAAVTVGSAATILPLRLGFNRLEVPVEAVDSSRSLDCSVTIDGTTLWKDRLTLEPVRRLELYLIPHSHNDIGYSDVQTDVERKQITNIRDALAIIERTREYPKEAQFKWNIEILWAVESFMKAATEKEKQEFVSAVKSGRLGLHAPYANQITGICRPEELLRLTDYSRTVERTYGLKINSAMISDIPGNVWSLVPALASAGVKYFTSGPNFNPSLPDGGDRIGRFSRAWGDRPFYWISPSGEQKILTWVAGTGYSWFHGWIIGKAGERTPGHLFEYLRGLYDQAYPYDIVQVRYTIVSDNGPPDPGLPDFVKSWNERYLSPRLVISTTAAMFEEFERRYGNILPSFSGDITPYWEDGALSTLKELSLVRRSTERLLQAEAAAAIVAQRPFPVPALEDAWRNVHLFDEHTWGAFNSVSDPDTPFAVAQWTIKRSFALNADSLSRACLTAMLQGSTSDAEGSRISVVNTNSWSRSDLVIVPQELSRTGDQVTDESGRLVRSQRLRSGELAFLASDVPALGARHYQIVQGKPSFWQGARAEGNSLSNGCVTITVDPKTGSITSLRADGIPADLVGSTGSIGINEYLYVPGRDPAGALRADSVRIRVKEPGPLVASLVVESSAPGARSLVREVRVIDGFKRVDLVNLIDKEKVRTKEAVHFAFPLNVPDGVVRLDNGWGIVRPEADQLPGSCKDYLYAQRWADASNQSFGVLLTLNESPLVEIGEMTNELPSNNGYRAWRDRIEPSTTLFAYCMNNYWHTNYKADQEGPVTLHYSLFPHGLFNAADAYRWGVERNQPLLVRRASSDGKAPSGLFTIEGSGVFATSLRPSRDGKAIMVRLYNAGGKPQDVSLKWGAFRPAHVLMSDLQESRGQSPKGTITMPAFGIITLRCER